MATLLSLNIVVELQPDHRVTVGLTFRALTLEPDLLGSLLDAVGDLPEDIIDRARRRQPFDLFTPAERPV